MSALLELQSLKKLYPVGKTGRVQHLLHAVDDVSLTIAPGESVGLVGESGCGKSTLARLVSRLIDPSSGSIRYEERDLALEPAARFSRSPLRNRIQMVFQDPTDSLNPRYTSFETIAESVRLLAGVRDAGEVRSRVEAAAAQVGLPHELLPRFPHQLSGGQKARVGIARAISVRPQLLILDEPTAALDVSVQAIILHLLAKLRAELGMSYLFVSHDLNIVRLLCHRVVVMYLGKVVESGPVEQVFNSPLHPYTRALIDAIPKGGAAGRPKPEADAAVATMVSGDPMSPVDPDPHTCRFFGRCPQSGGRCNIEMPVLQALRPGQDAACHFPLAPATGKV